MLGPFVSHAYFNGAIYGHCTVYPKAYKTQVLKHGYYIECTEVYLCNLCATVFFYCSSQVEGNSENEAVLEGKRCDTCACSCRQAYSCTTEVPVRTPRHLADEHIRFSTTAVKPIVSTYILQLCCLVNMRLTMSV